MQWSAMKGSKLLQTFYDFINRSINVEIAADLIMEDNTTPSINPWNTLSTMTTFDTGSDAKTTICVDNDSSHNSGQVVSLVTPSVSLLIESLIQQLCTLFEGDTVRRNKLYF
ncbi:PREDICTED: uncharacterized protein LOC107193247, partial [Dufourea novaeangliae]